MISRVSQRLLVILSVMSLMLTAVGCQRPTVPPAASGPSVVYYAVPVNESITDFEQFPGRTEAFKSVDIRARVTGYLEKLLFVDGSEVKEGDPLFQIDARPYKAIVDRSKATLEAAEAKEKRLEIDFRRLTALLSRGSAPREEYDRTAGDLAEARAQVGIAKAQLERDELDLSFTAVKAPISGRISRRMVDPGNLIKADETILTNIVALDPVYVIFDIDERTLLRIRRLIREGKVKSRNESEVTVMAGLADEIDFPHVGTINFSENHVDPYTGTLRIRGLINNPVQSPGSNTRVLSPGMFVRIRLPIGSSHPALLIPEQAVGTDQGRKFVYVIKDTQEKTKDGAPIGVVEYRPIEVGRLEDERSLRVVESGLNPGEKVVVRGLQRVKQAMKVTPILDGELGRKSLGVSVPKEKGSRTEAGAKPSENNSKASPVTSAGGTAS